jgi:hypothetical protein
MFYMQCASRYQGESSLVANRSEADIARDYASPWLRVA